MSPQQEERTFGAYAHGGTGSDRHLDAQGAPAQRDEEASRQPDPPPGGPIGAGAHLPSQASLDDVPPSCAEQRPRSA